MLSRSSTNSSHRRNYYFWIVVNNWNERSKLSTLKSRWQICFSTVSIMCPYALMRMSLCYFCMCPYASVHVSLCLHHCVLMYFACVLMLFCMCPYVIFACVHMLLCMCPYVDIIVCLYFHANVLMLFCMCSYAFLHVSLSLSGDVTRTVEFFRPIVQILYDMPEMRPEHGSEKWMSYMKKNMYQATFENLARYPELLRIFIRDMKKRGTKEGFPNLISGDSMTWSKYVPLKPSSLPSKLSPRVNTKHTYLQFLRSINLYVLMLSCMCPYVWMNVSLCLNSCVLMLYCMCPHSSMHASLCLNVCVLMFECMCPHVLTRVLLYIYP